MRPPCLLTVPDVLPAVQALYGRHGAGCCLHIVLDDGNLEDDHVVFCVDYARKEGHEECQELAEALLLMSRTQRAKLANHPHKVLPGPDEITFTLRLYPSRSYQA